MRRTTLAIFAGVTAVAVAAAIAVQPGGGLTTGRQGERLFPELEERINDVARITVRSGDDSVEIARGGEDDAAPWVVMDKDAYPAKSETVKKTLVVAADLAAIEPKTRRPEFYPRLEVEDPAAEDASSTLLTIEGEDGEALAEVIVGKRHYAAAGAGPQTTYVRLPDEDRAWLAEGDLQPKAEPGAWLDKRLTDVSRSRVQEVVLAGPDGVDLVLRRGGPDEEEWRIANLPAGQKFNGEADLRSIASTLFGFNFEDVAPADGKAEQLDDPFRTATFRTFDGLEVTLALGGDEADAWATVEARVDPVLRATWADAVAALQEPSSGDDDETTGSGAPDSAFKTAEEVEAEAAEINRRTEGWAYMLPDHKLGYVLTSLDGLTTPIGSETN